LFGSFAPEVEEPVYGLTIPLRTWNPLWANVHVFVDIAKQAAETERWRDKLGVIFGPPAWRPADLGGPVTIPEVTAETFEKYDPEPSTSVKWYAFVQFVSVLLGTLAALKAAEHLPAWQLAVIVFYVALSLSNLGSLLEKRFMGAADGDCPTDYPGRRLCRAVIRVSALRSSHCFGVGLFRTGVACHPEPGGKPGEGSCIGVE
jgi:hypothetical protein